MSVIGRLDKQVEEVLIYPLDRNGRRDPAKHEELKRMLEDRQREIERIEQALEARSLVNITLVVRAGEWQLR